MKKLKSKLEDRAIEACYLRRKKSNLYKVWIPSTKKITTVKITEFILGCSKNKEAEAKHTYDENVEDKPAAEKYHEPIPEVKHQQLRHPAKAENNCRVAAGKRIAAKDKTPTPGHTLKRKVIIANENGSSNVVMMVKEMKIDCNNEELFSNPDGGDIAADFKKKWKPHL